jgi:glycosyltransferase involved in cell wall biosynthesis
MMKIGIDVSQVVYGTGVATYTRNLASGLLREDKKNQYVLFGGYLRRKSDLEAFFDTLEGNFEKKLYPMPPTLTDIVWNRLHLINIEKLIGKVDVFHSSNWAQPPSNAFNVTTVHDLVPQLFPSQSNPKLVKVHTRRLDRVKQVVDRVIVPSRQTREDLQLVGIRKDIIRVIPEAPEITKRSSTESIIKLKSKYKLGKKYLLAIGANRRKNTKRIVSAFRSLKSEFGGKLVIIGHSFEDFTVPKGVLMLGHVPQDELATFYSGAEALVYPSLYEGFGIPILEAFAIKTPVVTSDLGSMKEIAGSAAEFVNPEDVDSIAKAILKVILNREKYVRLGELEVKKYSWKKMARMTLEVYKESI